MKFWWIFLIFIGAVVLSLFLVRLFLPSQLDDVTPGIYCEEELLDLADIYYVIPKFDNISIDGEWCDDILSRNKELAMHGVYHSFEEFGEFRDEEYLQEGIDIFEICFNVTPKRFKPGNLKFDDKNNWIRNRMDVDLRWNQVFHKVYHCSDTGDFPNWLIRLF